jgi:prepilin-type processing-associated H-X9-DG protein
MRQTDTTDGLSSTIMLAEVATDLGDQDTRTRPIPGPGAAVLRDNPQWGQEGGLIDAERPRFWQKASGKVLSSTTGLRRAYRWADGMPLYTGFNTILPPNREIVLRADRDDCWGILPPSSRHQGGANIAMGDGTVRFITDSIDAGDSSQPTVYIGSPNPPGSESPYGLWGALGTRASGELRAIGIGRSPAVE